MVAEVRVYSPYLLLMASSFWVRLCHFCWVGLGKRESWLFCGGVSWETVVDSLVAVIF